MVAQPAGIGRNPDVPQAFELLHPKAGETVFIFGGTGSLVTLHFFIFVHEDGAGLERISEIFKDTPLEASVDEVFSLDGVNKAMKKVASGGSKGKTILKVT